MISDIQLQKFKDIYRRMYQLELTNEQALEKATKLLELFKIILYQPLSAEEFTLLQKYRQN